MLHLNKKWMGMGCLVVLLLLSSCASRKSFVYLQDMHPGLGYPETQKHEAVIHRDDRISIVVSSKNPELALPFNVQGATYALGRDGSVTTSGGTSSREKGYRVDVDGNIDFPILGKIHVEGLTVSQLKDFISSQIINGNYIKEPLVQVEFLNFKYTVLGAVGSTGTYTVSGDRITLLEAIAKAGDLTDKARYDVVKVIREENGERRVYVHDIRSKEVFESPAYYLQQNDIVYVEPKYRKKDMEDRSWQITTFLISLGGLITSIIWALK